MTVVGIVGSGPAENIPDLSPYTSEVDVWIGADRGALVIAENNLPVDYAVGDFDSVSEHERAFIYEQAVHMDRYDREKDDTDLEIALSKAIDVGAREVYLFGVTGGRLDHALANVQLLYKLLMEDVRGIIVDKWNQIELKEPGSYTILPNPLYQYVSFVPFTKWVRGIVLDNFLYSLDKTDIVWGQTRLISNEFTHDAATFSFQEGLLLFVLSCDVDG